MFKTVCPSANCWMYVSRLQSGSQLRFVHPCFSNMSEYQLETGLRTALMTTGLDQSYHAYHAGCLSAFYCTLNTHYRIVSLKFKLLSL